MLVVTQESAVGCPAMTVSGDAASATRGVASTSTGIEARASPPGPRATRT
jgi:hypothetical protein